MDIEDLCDLIYYWLIRNLDEKERQELDELLNEPPENEQGPQGVTVSLERFMAF